MYSIQSSYFNKQLCHRSTDMTEYNFYTCQRTTYILHVNLTGWFPFTHLSLKKLISKLDIYSAISCCFSPEPLLFLLSSVVVDDLSVFSCLISCFIRFINMKVHIWININEEKNHNCKYCSWQEFLCSNNNFNTNLWLMLMQTWQ